MLDVTRINRAYPFAFLTPGSKSATQAVQHRANKLRRTRATDIAQNTGRNREVVRLDFAFIRGRRFLSFGSARAVEFHIPHRAVASCHFLLLLDPKSGSLALKDTSQEGTWISENFGVTWNVVLHQTHEIRGACTIRLGDNDDAVTFHMTCTDILRRPEGKALLKEYCSSIHPISQRSTNHAKSLCEPPMRPTTATCAPRRKSILAQRGTSSQIAVLS